MNRNFSLDHLRILATLMVVMIHVSGCFVVYIPESAGVNVKFTSFFGALSSCAVPLFFMISGALFLDKGKQVTIKGLLWRIFHVLVVMFLWNFVYALIDNWNNMSLYEMVKDTWKGHFHFWFIEYLVGVYLLIPVLKGLVEYEDGKFVKYYVIFFVIFGILKASLNSLLSPICNEEIRIITNKIHVELCDFCGYFVVGYYLNKSNHRINRYLLLSVFLFAVVSYYFITAVMNVQLVGTGAFTIFVFAEACALFLLFKDSCNHSKNPKLVAAISKATFGVYLIHPLFFEYVLPIGCFETMSEYIVLPVYYLIIVSLSFASSLAINNIPVLKRWLV